MKEKREVSVRELIKMFTAISYFQEVRLFKFSDIYEYIYCFYEYASDEYREKIELQDLIHEAEETLEDLVNEGLISYVYPDGLRGMYKVNDKINFLEIANYPKDYLRDMNKVFLDIHGGEPKKVILTLSNVKKNNR